MRRALLRSAIILLWAIFRDFDEAADREETLEAGETIVSCIDTLEELLKGD